MSTTDTASSAYALELAKSPRLTPAGQALMLVIAAGRRRREVEQAASRQPTE